MDDNLVDHRIRDAIGMDLTIMSLDGAKIGITAVKIQGETLIVEVDALWLDRDEDD